jgi:hypothetical protein
MRLSRILAPLFIAAPAFSQSGHDMGAMHMDHMNHDGAVTAAAKRQIDSVAKAVAKLGSTQSAAALGFHPVFGWIPTMGTHWIDDKQMYNKNVTRNAPGQLMFSKIAGHDSLVGAAYGYFTPVADTGRPSLFDGSPAWHEHQNLAPEGQTLVMLHVWFVPSPDGPFAGTNPNLPFWAVGLSAPDSARMHDPAFESRVRRAGLALAEVADTTAILPTLEQRPDVKAVLVPRRDSIRALIPEVAAAEKAKDTARWDRATEKLAAHWDAIQSAYLSTARTKAGKARIEQFLETLFGKHEH